MDEADTIGVVRPDGKRSRIPRSMLPLAIQKGYKPSEKSFLRGGEEAERVISWEKQQPLAGLGRGLYGLATMPYGVAKASAMAPQTKAEEYFSALGPGGLLLKRLVTEPAGEQAETGYRLAQQKRYPEAFGHLLASIVPVLGPFAANLGERAGTGDILGPAAEAATYGIAPKVGRVALKGVGLAGQEMGGAGREPVLRRAIERKAVVEERQAAHQQSVAEAETSYREAVDAYNKAEETKKAEHAGKVRQARQEWVEKAAAAKKAQAEVTRTVAQRQTLQRGVEEYGSRLRDNIQRTYQTTLDRLNSRWHHLRETPLDTMGNKLRDLPLNSKAIGDAVEHARETKLVGSPDSLRQFNDLMGWMEARGPEQTVGGEAGGITARLRPITWDEARTHYTALGERLFSGDLAGNVKQALHEVRSVLDKQLMDGATKARVANVYSTLKSDWSGFEDDWRDMSAIATRGGSPLARARMAPNVATLLPQVVGKTGDLLMQRLARYQDAGASVGLADIVRRLSKQIGDLPKVKPVKAPGKLELPPEPRIGVPPEMKRVRLYKEPAPLDPVSIRRERLLGRAERPMSWWDLLFPPAGVEHLLLKNPSVLEWLARQPRKEITPP